jgi:hypothetical protein
MTGIALVGSRIGGDDDWSASARDEQQQKQGELRHWVYPQPAICWPQPQPPHPLSRVAGTRDRSPNGAGANHLRIQQPRAAWSTTRVAFLRR